MKAAKESAVFDLLKHPCFQDGSWQCITQKNPELGQYGRTELYMWNHIPVFRLDISFNPPKTRAYVAEQWRTIPAFKLNDE